MNYLHLYSWSPRNVAGGMETVINTTAKMQAEIGHRAYILGRTYGVKKRTAIQSLEKVIYIEVERKIPRRPGTLQIDILGYILLFAEIFYTLFLLGFEIAPLIKKEKIDIIFFYGIHLLPLSILARLLGVKTILLFESIQKDPYPPMFSPKNLLRYFKYKCFNAVLTPVSIFYANEGIIPSEKLLKKYAGKSTPVLYLPWGIESGTLKNTTVDAMVNSYKKKGYKIIVCPRRLVEEKGVKYLLEALPKILHRFSKTLCIFTSYGILKEELQKRASELQIEKNILFTGSVPYKKVLQIIKGADVMVVPSSGEELFGMVFLEAYTLRVPIVTTKFGGIPGVVKNGRTGILVKPRDSKALADAVIDIFSHNGKRKILTEQGYNILYEKFQLHDTIKNIDLFIHKSILK